jgi:hypothetical protein
MRLRQHYRRPSTNDLFALALARTLGCALLSGDGALREVATRERVEIHGTLWLIDALLDARVVLVERVAVAYDAMQRDGSRSPWDQVKSQIQRWQSRSGAKE